MIRFHCPSCGKILSVNDDWAGRGAKCPNCLAALRVPEADDPPEQQGRSNIPVVSFDLPSAPPIPGAGAVPGAGAYSPPMYGGAPAAAPPSGGAGLGLGIAALVLGILALVVCWIPLIGCGSYLLGGIAMILGIIGFFLCLGGGSGMGLNIAGAGLGLLAMVVTTATLVLWGYHSYQFWNSITRNPPTAGPVGPGQRPVLNQGHPQGMIPQAVGPQQQQLIAACRWIQEGAERYSHGNGARYPNDIADLLRIHACRPENMLAPASGKILPAGFNIWPADRQYQWVRQNSSYVLVPDGKDDGDPDKIAAFMRPEDAGGADQIAVAFRDGHAEMMSPADAKTKLKTQTGMSLEDLEARQASFVSQRPAPMGTGPNVPGPVATPGPNVNPGVSPQPENPVAGGSELAAARQGFATKLLGRQTAKAPVPTPPAAVFDLVRYDAPVGRLAAYVTPDPKDGKKHPAIVWITGGDCNSLDAVWEDAPADNDQTAAAYRKAGIVMMFPSLRGGNDNPGVREGFLGEVDDVTAAGEYLSKQPFVDPARVYLGGHSTGGTLVLLTAECTNRFRAVFSFGPAADVSKYGAEYIPFDARFPREVELRSPLRWLRSIRSPVFVFEGTKKPSNFDSLQAMLQAPRSPQVQLLPVNGATHFTILSPMNKLIADKILADDGAKTNLTFTAEELGKIFP